MLYIERREKILEMLRKSGNVKVSDLVDIFHVDATTIRRDLKALADNEKVKTVYGGAYYINEMSQWPIEDNPDEKRTINIEKKQIVAQKAAKEIKDYYYPPNYSSYQSAFEQQLLLVQDQDKDPEEALADAVKEAKQIYDLEYMK